MDPGDIPEELQGLTEIEEMLIAQIFPIVSVPSSTAYSIPLFKLNSSKIPGII